MKNFVLLIIILLTSLTAQAATTEGNRVLNQAILSNDTSAVKQTLQLQVDINAPSFNGLYAIHAAATPAVKDEILSILLENGANPNISNKYGQTALHIAVLANSTNKVKLLLNANAQTDGALNLAVSQREFDPVEMTQIILSSKNTDVNGRDRKGYTSLILAVLRFNPSLETVDLLLAAGADKELIHLNYKALDFAQGILNFYKKRSDSSLEVISEVQKIVERLTP